MIDLLENQPRVVTLQDVATQAGVSRATASRALSGARKVSAEIIDRVQLAAQDLGYRPNQAARNLRLSRTMTLGAVFSRLIDPILLDFIEGLSRAGQEHGYSLLTMTARSDADLYKSLVQQLFERRVDALFAVLPPDLGTTLRPYIAAGVPVVTVFGHASNARYAPLIIVDEDDAALQAVRRLAEFGHRRILFLTGPAGAASSRVPALQAATGACGASLVLGLVPDRPAVEEIEAALRRYVLHRPAATAIFANTMLAPALLQALRRLHLQVPADISLVTFGGSTWVQELDLGWATIHSDLQDVGYAAIQVVLDWLAGTPPPDITKIASAQWVERASIGPVCDHHRLRVVKRAKAAGS